MATLIGTEDDERLIGTIDSDFISGGAGEDVIFGSGGNDVIDSVDRPDNIFAGVVPPERDRVFAGDGDDTVTGGRLDELNGGPGRDFLSLNFNFDGPNPNPAAVQLKLNGNGVGVANDGTSIRGFESVNFTLTNQADTVDTGNVQATLDGQDGDDQLTTGSGNDQIFGGGGDDTISSGSGDDTLSGGGGNDIISGGDGNDTLFVDPSLDGMDQVDLGAGSDTVSFGGFNTGQIRLTFTSAEVGNGSATDAGTMAGQDGGLAVRVQREDAAGNLIGEVSRYDDEGITFLEGTQGYTFDVRDLVSGVQRGDQFIGVVLGTSGDDQMTFFPPFRAGQAFYYNGGMGNDTVVAGSANDFLVGGLGNDTLTGNAGDDTLLGGAGMDTANFNVSTDGADKTDLGADMDTVNVSAATAGQVRLTFTSAEVGNGVANDSNTMANQDGALAVRLQAEDDTGALTGSVSRFDDEGITFVSATPGLTFDVRDLVSGVARGDQFQVVTLGTSSGDTIKAVDSSLSTYINAGAGDDTVTGGRMNDFLVGGSGNDLLNGGLGNDSFLGGTGNDRLVGGSGNDTLDGGAGVDRLFGGAGDDTLTGGADQDFFAFTLADGSDSDDLVTDFALGIDKIILRDLAIDSMTDTSGGAKITFDNGATAIFQGIVASDLTPGQFVFQNEASAGTLMA